MRSLKDFLYDFCVALYILALPGSLFFAAVKSFCLRRSLGVVAANAIPAIIIYFVASYIAYYRAHRTSLHATNDELRREVERLFEEERAELDNDRVEMEQELAQQQSQLDAECVAFIEKCRREESALDEQWSKLNAERRSLALLRKSLEDERSELNRNAADSSRQVSPTARDILSAPDFSHLFRDSFVCSFRTAPPFENERIASALTDKIEIIPPVSASCSVRGTKGDIYKVTMDRCTCHDFIYRRQPCKHMYRLALSLGYLAQNNTSGIEKVGKE